MARAIVTLKITGIMNGAQILKVAVIAMGGLIFVLLGVVVWRLGTLSDDQAGEGAPAVAQTSAPADLSLNLAPACRIAEIASDSGRLMVRTTGPSQSCDAVYLFDLATGDRMGSITP